MQCLLHSHVRKLLFTANEYNLKTNFMKGSDVGKSKIIAFLKMWSNCWVFQWNFFDVFLTERLICKHRWGGTKNIVFSYNPTDPLVLSLCALSVVWRWVASISTRRVPFSIVRGPLVMLFSRWVLMASGPLKILKKGTRPVLILATHRHTTESVSLQRMCKWCGLHIQKLSYIEHFLNSERTGKQ